MDGTPQAASADGLSAEALTAAAVARLEKRARRARANLLRIGLMTFMVIYAFAAYGLIRYLEADKTKPGPTAVNQADWTMQSRIGALITAEDMRPDHPDPIQEQRAAASRQKLSDALDQWERVKRIEGLERAQQSPLSQWLPLVLQGLIVFGLIAFVGFTIQIGLMFMRFYARLAELYDTQVDALYLSRGDIALATQLMDKFSPNSIDIGRPPKSVHEALLEGIARATSKDKS